MPFCAVVLLIAVGLLGSESAASVLCSQANPAPYARAGAGAWGVGHTAVLNAGRLRGGADFDELRLARMRRERFGAEYGKADLLESSGIPASVSRSLDLDSFHVYMSSLCMDLCLHTNACCMDACMQV